MLLAGQGSGLEARCSHYAPSVPVSLGSFVEPTLLMNNLPHKEYSQGSCRDRVSNLFSLVPMFPSYYELPSSLPEFRVSFSMELQAQLEAGAQAGDDAVLWGNGVTGKCVWQNLTFCIYPLFCSANLCKIKSTLQD